MPIDFQEKNMKLTFSFIAATLITFAGLTVRAQTTQPPVAPAAPIKMAIIDTEAFADTKTGVKKLINAFTQVDNELAPIRQDLINKNNRLQALTVKANAGTLTQAEADEADNLKRDIQRGQEDGQRKAQLLTQQRTGPVFNELSTALQNFAKQRGFDMIVDVAKLQNSILLINPSIDITSAFITDFNAKNPAAAVAPTTPVKP